MTSLDVLKSTPKKKKSLEHYKMKYKPVRLKGDKLKLHKSHNDLPINNNHKLGTEKSRISISALQLEEIDDIVYFDGVQIKVIDKVGYGSSANVYKVESPLLKSLSQSSSNNSLSNLENSGEIDIPIITEEKVDEHVAVKVCKYNNASDKKDIAAEKEILLSNHGCPHIVKCYGIITDNIEKRNDVNDIGFILEYHKLGNLNEYLIKNPNDEYLQKRETIISFAKDIIKAIYFVHVNLNVIHRDIRSSNFLVTTEMKLLLCDFGTARKDTEYNRNTTLKTAKTNPRWTAPELYDIDLKDQQIRTNINSSVTSYTFASDIYSIAIVLWEIFNYYVEGKYSAPFGISKHPFKIINEIMEGIRPDISNNKFPNDFKEILYKTWDQNPNKRLNIHELLVIIDEMS